ncbi:MAG: hypothetical protein EZS28_023431 [Streblomastix strix]|uniref:Uncharacterized protein n=1 Tax=Streblomastix strix TaxID=222440 RepID=A0A5J4VEK4_9EUKA|nr:MAG: hypothetical protein EZS28_023431 [Streblomastix strix]
MNAILEIKFNPTLFIEFRAFKAIRIRLKIPPDATTPQIYSSQFIPTNPQCTPTFKIAEAGGDSLTKIV